MKELLKNRRLALSQFSAVVGGILLEGFLLAALVAKTCTGFFSKWNPILLIIAYLAVSIAGVAIANRSNKPIMSLLGYHMVVVPAGAVLSVILPGDAQATVVHALLITAGVIVAMIIASQYKPKIFLRLGSALTFALLAVIVVEVIVLLVGGSTWSWWNFIVAALFALFIGYDWARAVENELTLDSAIDACVDLFVDALNLFLRVRNILDNDR